MLDVNGDGNLDLLYLNQGFGTVAIMYGNGDGTMNAPVEFPGNADNGGLALADLDGDGAVDVLAGSTAAGGFSVFRNGNGSGTAQNYTLGTNTPSATVASGASATYTLNLSGRNGYTGTITFACSNLPAGAACTFNPSSVVAHGDTPLSTVMTISTTAQSAALLRPAGPSATPPSPVLLASLGGAGLLGLLLAGSGPKARRRRTRIVFGVVLLMTLGTVVGCDNGNSTITSTASTGTPAGAYSVTATSTGTGTGAPTHSVNVTLVVQ
jgi:hypothetical protein